MTQPDAQAQGEPLAGVTIGDRTPSVKQATGKWFVYCADGNSVLNLTTSGEWGRNRGAMYYYADTEAEAIAFALQHADPKPPPASLAAELEELAAKFERKSSESSLTSEAYKRCAAELRAVIARHAQPEADPIVSSAGEFVIERIVNGKVDCHRVHGTGIDCFVQDMPSGGKRIFAFCDGWQREDKKAAHFDWRPPVEPEAKADASLASLNHVTGWRPTIVCLCGSTRFYKQFMEANYRETLANKIVLSVGFYPHAANEMHGESVGITDQVKRDLDELHKRKIDIADEVLILNVGNYIGSSTRSELEYAKAHGKVIRFLEPHAEAKADHRLAKCGHAAYRDHDDLCLQEGCPHAAYATLNGPDPPPAPAAEKDLPGFTNHEERPLPSGRLVHRHRCLCCRSYWDDGEVERHETHCPVPAARQQITTLTTELAAAVKAKEEAEEERDALHKIAVTPLDRIYEIDVSSVREGAASESRDCRLIDAINGRMSFKACNEKLTAATAELDRLRNENEKLHGQAAGQVIRGGPGVVLPGDGYPSYIAAELYTNGRWYSRDMMLGGELLKDQTVIAIRLPDTLPAPPTAPTDAKPDEGGSGSVFVLSLEQIHKELQSEKGWSVGELATIVDDLATTLLAYISKTDERGKRLAEISVKMQEACRGTSPREHAQAVELAVAELCDLLAERGGA